MNVTEKSTGNVSAEITVKIEKADYQEKVEKALRSYRQRAVVPGFRKGMAPKSMIQKMVGKSILVDEINTLISEQLYNYITDKKLAVLGEPLPKEGQPEVDFDTQEDFEFTFDVALAPAVKVELSKDDKIAYSEIIVDEEMINKQVEAYKNRFGKQEEGEVIAENDIAKGKMVELNEDGTVKEGGIVVESGMISPRYTKNEGERAKFIGVKKGEKVVFNPSVASEGNDTEVASMLHIKKEEAAEVKSNFEMEITSILAFKPAEMGQELFDAAFGKDNVKDEADFRAKIAEMLKEQIAPEADYKFAMDARTYIESKVGELEFADAMLKRWLKFSDKENKIENVDEEYVKMLPDLKWQLIKEQIVKDAEIKVEKADIEEMAKKATKMQFAQYGMANVPEDLLQKYAEDMMKDKNIVNNMLDRVMEEKIVEVIKSKVTLENKQVTLEDFYKSLEVK